MATYRRKQYTGVGSRRAGRYTGAPYKQVRGGPDEGRPVTAGVGSSGAGYTKRSGPYRVGPAGTVTGGVPPVQSATAVGTTGAGYKGQGRSPSEIQRLLARFYGSKAYQKNVYGKDFQPGTLAKLHDERVSGRSTLDDLRKEISGLDASSTDAAVQARLKELQDKLSQQLSTNKTNKEQQHKYLDIRDKAVAQIAAKFRNNPNAGAAGMNAAHQTALAHLRTGGQGQINTAQLRTNSRNERLGEGQSAYARRELVRRLKSKRGSGRYGPRAPRGTSPA